MIAEEILRTENSHIQYYGYIENTRIINDLITLIKLKYPSISIDEFHPIFIKYDDLKRNYLNKIENNKEPTKEEENVNKLLVYHLNYKIGFGKYKGTILYEIILQDPQFILKCIINLDHFTVSDCFFLFENVRDQPEYLLALEYNLIKKLIIRKYKSMNKDGTFRDFSYDHDDFTDEPIGNNEYTDEPPREYNYGPEAYGYKSWEEMTYWEVFEGNGFEYREFLDQ